jgi:hypothetical protein
MNPSSASDWQTKWLGLDMDLPIIAVIRKALEKLVLRNQLAVGLRMRVRNQRDKRKEIRGRDPEDLRAHGGVSLRGGRWSLGSPGEGV